MPVIDETAYLAEGSYVTGEVTVGAEASVWHCAVLRGDIAVGDDVTIGHGAIVHGCTVGSGSLIGMGSIILNGAVIGEGALIGAGALVTEGHVIEPHTLAFGSPAKVVRELTSEEVESLRENARVYVELARTARDASKDVEE